MGVKQPIALVKGMDEVKDFIKCADNPWYFVGNFIYIIHQLYGEVLFKMFPFQKQVLYEFIKNKYSITLKPRQMGMTTLVCAYALWLCLFHKNKKVIMISIKASVASAMLNKIKKMYRRLPDHLKIEVINGASADTVGTVTKIVFANGSEIEAIPATEDAGRSEAASLVIMDEVAFQEYASAIWGSIQQTLATGGQGILLSTAYGVGNFFHETWVGALQKVNGFSAIMLNWKMHPEKTQEWYEEQIKLLGTKRTAQEIDCDFLQSGYNVFDLAKIKAIEERLNNTKPLEVQENGQMLVYKLCDPAKRYIIGADIATGKARDYSAMSIMDEKGVEHACYKGKIGVNNFGHFLMRWGAKYNMALLAPEANSIGEGIIATLEENNYPNIFHSISRVFKAGEFERHENLTKGWLTTGKSRSEIITGMDDDLEDETIEINNPFFVQEAYTFIYNMANKPIALGKELGKGKKSSMYEEEGHVAYTDDAIFSCCIANEVRKNPRKWMADLPFSGGR